METGIVKGKVSDLVAADVRDERIAIALIGGAVEIAVGAGRVSTHLELVEIGEAVVIVVGIRRMRRGVAPPMLGPPIGEGVSIDVARELEGKAPLQLAEDRWRKVLVLGGGGIPRVDIGPAGRAVALQAGARIETLQDEPVVEGLRDGLELGEADWREIEIIGRETPDQGLDFTSRTSRQPLIKVKGRFLGDVLQLAGDDGPGVVGRFRGIDEARLRIAPPRGRRGQGHRKAGGPGREGEKPGSR